MKLNSYERQYLKLSSYEKQYMGALKRIYKNGFSDGVNERTGKETKRLPGIVIQVDVEEEFPILKSKQVFGKTALREIMWIWQQQSNNIHDLKAKIWDSWADENGSIQKAYGFQMNRPICIYTDTINKTPESFRSYRNQAEYILEYLREFPNGRWGVATIWNPEELSGMNLVPCCHTSTWNLDGGRLNCVLDQRSGDMPYGVPFNTTQYAQLMILLARDLGVKPGILTHVIADAHIYANQMEGVYVQLKNYEALKTFVENENSNVRISAANEARKALADYIKNGEDVPTITVMYNVIMDALHSEPEFVIDSDVTDFFKIDIEKCSIQNYKHMGKLDFGDIAV